ncbi:MAG: DUF3653 domain-containing protein [Lysobacteraceae bacterium]
MNGIAPCHIPGDKPNPCAVALHQLKHYGNADLGGPWKGWRIAGRVLVTPQGLRLPVERVKGLAWRQDAEDHLTKIKAANRARERSTENQHVKVVVVTLAEFRAQRTGAA